MSFLEFLQLRVTCEKTLEAVKDEHLRGPQVKQQTSEKISQEIALLHEPLTPKDLIRVTKNVTVAAADSVKAADSAFSEMMIICRAVAWSCAKTDDLRQQTLDAAEAVATAYRYLLETTPNGSTDEQKQFSQKFAKCSTYLITMAQFIIAENELFDAYASIHAERKRLISFRTGLQFYYNVSFDDFFKAFVVKMKN